MRGGWPAWWISILVERFLDEAVAPPFARFGRGDNRIAAGACVFARVTVRRRVAAARCAAALTCAEMHPLSTDLGAVLTGSDPRMLDVVDRVDVRASVWHTLSAYHGVHDRRAVAGAAVRGLEGHLRDAPHVDAGGREGLGDRDAGHLAVCPRGRCRMSGARSPSSFDFIDHTLTTRASDGAIRTMTLAPRSVADFSPTGGHSRGTGSRPARS